MSLSSISFTVFAGALVLSTPVYAVETGILPGGHGAALSSEIATDNGLTNADKPAQDDALAQRKADWLGAPPDPDRHTLWIPTAEWAVALSLTIPLFMIDPAFVHTGTFSADHFVDAWKRPPVWDTDGHVANYVLHPIMGAEAYLTARNRDYGPITSFLFASGVSFAWEYVFEAWVEQPSTQDLLVTSPIGALQGELRFQIRRRLARWRPSLGRNTLMILVDPIEAIHRFIGKCGDTDEIESSSLSIGPDQARLMVTMKF
jgi:hypothetical protein